VNAAFPESEISEVYVSNPPSETRVLLAAPTIRDGEITRDLLIRNHIPCVVCPNLHVLTQEISAGVGAILLTDQSLALPQFNELLAILEKQPHWSLVPMVILIRGGGEAPLADRVYRSLENVTLLERPAPMRSLVSAVQAAVRGRQRQYEIRDQLQTIRQVQEQREQLLESERAARAEAERAGRMKDEFLATVSHELRTPLNAIVGWSQLLRQSLTDKATLEEGVAVIERNARIQVQLIEDLLDMSRIIAGTIRLDIQPTEAAAFIDAAIETVNPAAIAKSIRLEKIIGDSAAVVSGDSGRLQQVVWNLLSNAIKFTPREGKVQVITERVDSHLEISVADTGQGITPQFLPHVFERFRQADASTTRTFGGLGIGLAIVKHLIELHGGTVRAASPGEGHGSTFTVRIPLSPVSRRYLHPANSPDVKSSHEKNAARLTPLQGISVMVVDDEPDACTLLKRILEDSGAKVTAASSAQQALQFLDSEKPDVLISDIGMPIMDGYDFIRRVRTLESTTGKRIPAIALTAFARSEDRTRALLAGYLVHVSKPVEPRELIATVASVAGLTGNV
jgi:signal transduction histidine kinase/ActR/RegA family two-component response regulator